jgi:hypothetical protein
VLRGEFAVDTLIANSGQQERVCHAELEVDQVPRCKHLPLRASPLRLSVDRIVGHLVGPPLVASDPQRTVRPHDPKGTELSDDYATISDIAMRPAWQRRAACRGKGTDWWFPTTSEADEAARAVCEPCPVRRPVFRLRYGGS